MTSFMIVQIYFETKKHVTIPTLEGHLSCVSFCMVVQTSLGKEPLATALACKRYFVRVSPFMCTKATFSWKTLVTMLALEKLSFFCTFCFAALQVSFIEQKKVVVVVKFHWFFSVFSVFIYSSHLTCAYLAIFTEYEHCNFQGVIITPVVGLI